MKGVVCGVLLRARCWLCCVALLGGVCAGGLQAQTITLASTTSTEQSGLFSHLLPLFQKATGIAVRVVALGTGQALDLGRRGDVDLVFVHDATAEDAFVAQGHGLRRIPVMHNDMVLVGPQGDPASLRGRDIVQAMRKLAEANAKFLSRGDRSGTHMAELRFWELTGQGNAKGSGWRECGCGMGPALNMAGSMGAYLLVDRGTWLSFRNRSGMGVLVEGDARLLNPYSVILINPEKHRHVKFAAAQQFAQWITSSSGQAAIAAYRVGGEQLFFPAALN